MQTKIFLLNLALCLVLLSCGKKVEVSIIDHPKQQLNNYITEFDENTCQLDTEDNKESMTTPLSDPSINGMVCFKKEVASKLLGRMKADCINKKPNPNSINKNLY